MENQLLNEPASAKPPKGLMALLVLTFINTGGAIVMGFVSLLFFQPTAESLRKSKIDMAKSISVFKEIGFDEMADLLNRFQVMAEILNHNFLASTSLNILFSMIGCVSAVLMYKRNILGFHAYIIYNLLAASSIYFFVSPAYIPSVILITNLLISLVFVLLYSRHLKWLRKEA